MIPKKRILLLDDAPGFCGTVKSYLEKRNIEVVTAGNMDEVSELFKVNPPIMLIHGVHKTKTNWSICEETLAHHPDLPTIHLDVGEVCKEHQRPHGNIHGKLRHLASPRELFTKVNNLCKLGDLFSENKRLNLILKLQNKLDQALDTLEPEAVIGNFMSFAGPEMDAKNILWLVEGDIAYYSQQMWKIKQFREIDQLQYQQKSTKSVGWNKVGPTILSSIIDELDAGKPSEWSQVLRAITVHSSGKNFKKAIVIPIFENKKNYGHMIILDPAKSISSEVLHYWTERLTQSYRRALSYHEARSLCYIDDVTDLYNQRYLGLVLETEISRAKRSSSPFSVLFIDIDHFKKVNDTKGHLVGSNLLQQLSRILKRNTRTVDYGFRYGGDEYLLLLVNTDAEAARVVGERIREDVQGTIFDVDGVEFKITLSIGVATFPEHASTKEEIIKMADKAMYDGKNKSRNIVFVAS